MAKTARRERRKAKTARRERRKAKAARREQRTEKPDDGGCLTPATTEGSTGPPHFPVALRCISCPVTATAGRLPPSTTCGHCRVRYVCPDCVNEMLAATTQTAAHGRYLGEQVFRPGARRHAKPLAGNVAEWERLFLTAACRMRGGPVCPSFMLRCCVGPDGCCAMHRGLHLLADAASGD
jgi:hypothetical protein